MARLITSAVPGRMEFSCSVGGPATDPAMDIFRVDKQDQESDLKWHIAIE
jgi:hypothetical protein